MKNRRIDLLHEKAAEMDFPFPVLSCPSGIRKVADDYKDIAGVHYRAFTASICAYIFGISSFSDMVRFLMFSPSVSALSRFFNDPEVYPKLNRRHRRRLLRIMKRVHDNPNRYMWAVDDTLMPHFGKMIWGAYTWFDHNTKGYVFGHKLMVLGLVDRNRKTLIPVFWEILHREIEGQEQKHEKGWSVALKLLDQAIEMGFPKLTLVADSWFAGEEFFQALSSQKRKQAFVIEIKSNRIVQGHGPKKNLGISVDVFFKDRSRIPIFYRDKKKWAAEATLHFKDSKLVLKTAAVANKKGLANEVFAFYVSNQLTWNASKLWAFARDRWSIEVQFRDFKQIFTLGGAAVRSKQAVETSISVSVIALTVIRLEQLARADANENQYVRPIPAGGIVNEHRLKSMAKGISKLVSGNTTQIKQRIQSRLHRENFGRKPAERVIPSKTHGGIGQLAKVA